MRPACLGVRAELSLTWRLQTRQGQESSLRVPPPHTPECDSSCAGDRRKQGTGLGWDCRAGDRGTEA